jgi:hypothetical protein
MSIVATHVAHLVGAPLISKERIEKDSNGVLTLDSRGRVVPKAKAIAYQPGTNAPSPSQADVHAGLKPPSGKIERLPGEQAFERTTGLPGLFQLPGFKQASELAGEGEGLRRKTDRRRDRSGETDRHEGLPLWHPDLRRSGHDDLRVQQAA